MNTINRIVLDKTTLNNSYQKSIYVEIAHFKTSNVYQVYSPGYSGVFLFNNKIEAFKKYFEVRNSINNANNKINLN